MTLFALRTPDDLLAVRFACSPLWETQAAVRTFADGRGLSPLGRLVAYSHAGVEPRIMGMGPVPAVRKVLDRAGLKLDEIDLFEVNEAFAAQALAVIRELGLPPERTNPNGSGVSLGHPVGATGAILAVKALYELRRTGGRSSSQASATRRSSCGRTRWRPATTTR